ncbi:acyl-CoA dehydrogenase C-terminal domain-containing protein [soil metagenome]
MWTYEPPLRDMQFVVEELIGAPTRWSSMPAFEDVDVDTARRIVEEAGKFASEVLAPTNQNGDLEGCSYDAGVVSTPAGFREAYAAFVEAGWPALACDPEVGGQGLPQLLNAALYEMLCSSNHAWSMYPALLQGAYDCLHAHASDELKRVYLGKVVSGEWLSTMCMTEAHAGSDLGMLRTRAEPAADGSFALRGTKIFISGGEHDLTENIVHLVLARLLEAPPGTRGLSLFLVPKRIPVDGGFVANAVRCDSIEKKMGIKGSATCVISFDGATGWLIGEPNRGLAAMFVMMNASRLHVGLQGLGHAEAAYQNALRYANERLQMRAVVRPGDNASTDAKPATPADPIAWHPAVRRVLWTLRARLEGSRVLAYESAHLLDLVAHAADPAQREQAADLVSLLTPVIKSFMTENGFVSASAALQLYGGHGYVHDYGIEQCVRDSRIAMIYEGTNEIQAIDLLVRKVLPDGGKKMFGLLDWLEAGLQGLATTHRAAALNAIGNLRGVTERLADGARDDAERGLRVASDYLTLVALTVLAQGWAKADAVAAAALDGGASDESFYLAKRDTANHFFGFVLPEAAMRLQLIDTAASQPLPFVATT